MSNSVFDLFGEINLESKAFQGSLRHVEARLKATDKDLDGVISKANKLGDTSATVARRYERLGESIQQQRNRLLDNATAFHKGEISAQKFSSVVTSVDKNITNLNSKLRDAKARLTELNETGLTHLQQQIQGAVGQQSTDVFKRLSSFQKGQLAMQGGDIFTQLASGTSPFQVLVQQGPQIAQIFAMSKAGSDAVATSTAAAAASQAAFAASSTASVAPQAAVATSSAATAASMEAAAAASTILGASVVSLGAILAAGLVTILAVYRAVQDIEKAAKERLANEEKITAEWNKQHGLIGQIKKELAEAAKERAFGSFVSGASLSDLNASRNDIFSQLEANQKKITGEMQRRQLLAAQDTRGLLPKDYVASASSVGTLSTDQIKSMTEQLKQLDAQIYAEKARLNADHNKNVIEGAMRSAASVRDAHIKAEVELAKKRKEMVEKAIEDAKKWAEHVKQAGEAVKGIFASTSDNPFVKIFTDGEAAVARMLEATKGLGSSLQNRLKELLNAQTASNAFKQSMENALKSSNLRSEAAQFLGKAKPTVSESLQKQLEAIGAPGAAGFTSDTFKFGSGVVGDKINQVDPNQRARDQKIIELTRGLSDDALTPAQKQLAAAARIREADALDKEKTEAVEVQKELRDLLKEMKGQKALDITIDDPAGRTTATTGTPQTVNVRYGAKN